MSYKTTATLSLQCPQVYLDITFVKKRCIFWSDVYTKDACFRTNAKTQTVSLYSKNIHNEEYSSTYQIGNLCSLRNMVNIYDACRFSPAWSASH